MAIVFKRIKPSKFNSAVFTELIIAEMEDYAKEVEKDFMRTTRTWEHQPKFETVMEVLPDGPAVLVATDDEIYGYVNDGTPPHDIVASTNEGMTFNWDGYGSYGAKTMPGVLFAVNSIEPGEEVTLMSVSHPGIEARNFDEAIQEKHQPRFVKAMENAMKRAAKSSNHSME